MVNFPSFSKQAACFSAFALPHFHLVSLESSRKVCDSSDVTGHWSWALSCSPRLQAIPMTLQFEAPMQSSLVDTGQPVYLVLARLRKSKPNVVRSQSGQCTALAYDLSIVCFSSKSRTTILPLGL